MPDSAKTPKRKKRRRPPPPLPAPRFSACLYVRIAPENVGMFRFLLEAEDNLAYASTVDRWKSVVRVVFSPHQERAVRRFLAGMRETIPFAVIYEPGLEPGCESGCGPGCGGRTRAATPPGNNPRA